MNTKCMCIINITIITLVTIIQQNIKNNIQILTNQTFYISIMF